MYLFIVWALISLLLVGDPVDSLTDVVLIASDWKEFGRLPVFEWGKVCLWIDVPR